ncbi:MAG: hypothetical protein IAE79_21150 [Anaerolinea sp.]|nr:hypothetical protein [Anaerolinea sp.]
MKPLERINKILPYLLHVIIIAIAILVIGYGINRTSSSIQGVLIGVGGTLLVTGANTLFNSITEDKQWQRQLNREREKLLEEKRASLRKMYEKGNSALSKVTTIKTIASTGVSIFGNVNSSTAVQIYSEAHEWLTVIYYHCLETQPNNEIFIRFRENFHQFSEQSSGNIAALQEDVLDLASSDPFLFDKPLDVFKPVKKQKINDPQTTLHIKIDPDYCEQQFLDSGVLLDPNYQFQVVLSQLTDSQRQKLWGTHIGGVKSGLVIWKRTALSIPTGIPVPDNLEMWTVEFNPKDSSVEELLEKWETAFDRALEMIKVSQATNT